MKVYAIAAAIFLGSASATFAADLTGGSIGANRTYVWSGAYGGVLLGYGIGASHAVGNPGFDGSAPDDRADLDPDGFVGGVVAGYNWQRGQWVFGRKARLAISVREIVFGSLMGTIISRIPNTGCMEV